MMRRYSFILPLLCSVLFLFSGLFAGNSCAQHKKTVTVKEPYYLTPDQSREEGKQELLKIARKKAIEKTFGVSVSANTFQGTIDSGNGLFESFAQLIRTELSGKIVDEQEPEYSYPEAGKIMIRYTATVAKEKGRRDPNFEVKIEPAQQSYSLSDEGNDNLSFTVKTSKDAYITAFSVTEDGKVAMIYPNQFMQDNFIKANTPRTIRGKNGIEFDLTLSNKKDEPRYQEMLLCVATKKKISYEELNSKVMYDDAWVEVNRWIYKIPRNMRDESYADYLITK